MYAQIPDACCGFQGGNVGNDQYVTSYGENVLAKYQSTKGRNCTGFIYEKSVQNQMQMSGEDRVTDDNIKTSIFQRF